jgi:hypothetical protein
LPEWDHGKDVSGQQTLGRNVLSTMKMKSRLQRRTVLQLLASATVGATPALASPESVASRSAHVAWVAECLKRTLTVRPGMSRSQLMTVFSTEGGLSTALQRTFVSRDCPFFKADVTFHRAAAEQSGSREALLWELDNDVISTISQLYLQFSIYD